MFYYYYFPINIENYYFIVDVIYLEVVMWRISLTLNYYIYVKLFLKGGYAKDMFINYE